MQVRHQVPNRQDTVQSLNDHARVAQPVNLGHGCFQFPRELVDLLALEQGHVADDDVAHVADGDHTAEQSQTIVVHFSKKKLSKNPTQIKKKILQMLHVL
jgi:hypothetical protein